MVDRRLDCGSHGKKDIYSYILDNDPKSKDLTLKDLYSNSATILMAGSETSATALCGLMYFICKSPDAYKRLVKEIREAFPCSEDISLLQLGKLTYLNACLKEAMRLYPPIPGRLPRVVPSSGAAVCGKWMPGGVCTPQTWPC
jgi:cytochrome P450